MAVATVRIRYAPGSSEKWMLDVLVDQCPAWTFNWLCYCEFRIGHDNPHWAYADSWAVGHGWPGGLCDDA